MTLITIIIALVIEQLHALSVERYVKAPVARLAALLDDRFNDGRYSHGAVAWLLGVAVPALLLLLLQGLLAWYQPLLGFLLGIGVLYLTMGFRQFSHYFTEIHIALRAGEIDQARQILAAWRGRSGDQLSSSEVARLAIEKSLLASYRHVFAPLFWFAVLGPAGALLYRLAQTLAALWREPEAVPGGERGQFGSFAAQAFAVIDWLPQRLTAIGFAVVGDFEDAIHCWRTQAARWHDAGSGILLASGAGALGVKLGMPVRDTITQAEGAIEERPELGLGEEADPDFMQSTIGLVWRTLVLGLLLLALVSVSGWVGG